MDLDLVFDGTNTPPALPSGPWLQATFADQGPNGVLFTLEATTNLVGAENLKQFYFNFDDALDLGGLGVTPIDTSGSFEAPTWTFNENSLKADGDGKYDVRLDFLTGGDPALTFTTGDRAIWLLTYDGVGSMDETSFNFFSQPAGGVGPFVAAAHIQNTTGGGSAWVAAEQADWTPIPEPTGLALIGVAGLGFLLHRRPGKPAKRL